MSLTSSFAAGELNAALAFGRQCVAEVIPFEDEGLVLGDVEAAMRQAFGEGVDLGIVHGRGDHVAHSLGVVHRTLMSAEGTCHQNNI